MKKKIYVCPKCGRGLNFSDNPEYTFQCFECDEDFYAFEAREVEQPRMEGIVDYTDLAKASMEIQAITDKAIQESTKQIEIKGKDIVEQVLEYINETIHPILSSGLYKTEYFSRYFRMRTSHFELSVGEYIPNGKSCQAQLFGDNGTLRAFFDKNGDYFIEQYDTRMLPWLVDEWTKLKEEVKRKITFCIDGNNNANQNKLKKQEELSKLVNSFRL
jgi:hypothetical protein